MENVINELKNYNLIARLVEGNLYIMMEYKPGEYTFLTMEQIHLKQIVDELNLEVLN